MDSYTSQSAVEEFTARLDRQLLASDPVAIAQLGYDGVMIDKALPQPADIPDSVPETDEDLFGWTQSQSDFDDQPVEPVEHPFAPFGASPVGDGPHIVKRGEDIGSIAAQHGLLPDTLWQTNEALRTARGDPYVLLPGDRVAIPDLTTVARPARTGARHVYRRKGIPLHLRLELHTEEQEAYASLPYVIEGEGFHREGTTDGSGLLEEWVPPALERVKISFPSLQDAMTCEVGALDPLHSASGVQARLNNLGFHCGALTGEVNLLTIMALGQFRTAHRITAQKGVLFDEPTLQALAQQHGC